MIVLDGRSGYREGRRSRRRRKEERFGFAVLRVSLFHVGAC